MHFQSSLVQVSTVGVLCSGHTEVDRIGGVSILRTRVW